MQNQIENSNSDHLTDQDLESIQDEQIKIFYEMDFGYDEEVEEQKYYEKIMSKMEVIQDLIQYKEYCCYMQQKEQEEQDSKIDIRDYMKNLKEERKKINNQIQCKVRYWVNKGFQKEVGEEKCVQQLQRVQQLDLEIERIKPKHELYMKDRQKQQIKQWVQNKKIVDKLKIVV